MEQTIFKKCTKCDESKSILPCELWRVKISLKSDENKEEHQFF
jgi:hypothetical protein